MVHHLHSQTMNHYFPLHSFKPTNIDRTFPNESTSTLSVTNCPPNG